MATPRVVVVHRRSEYAELLAHHGTRGQADFFLRTRGRDLAEVEARHRALEAGLQRVAEAIPLPWRRARVERTDLASYLFAPDDLVVVVGQDGLVPNVAKYLRGQLVIGINPDPAAIAGVLVRHRAEAAGELMAAAVAGELCPEPRTMVALRADDGQQLVALNEVYLGQPTHQTARYLVHWAGRTERQASSGLIVGTGTGATGWCLSAWLGHRPSFELPGPTSRDLAWFVREAWPSPTTGTTLTEGLVGEDELVVDVHSDTLVAFGDGIEADHLTLGYGQRLHIGRADRVLQLV